MSLDPHPTARALRAEAKRRGVAVRQVDTQQVARRHIATATPSNRRGKGRIAPAGSKAAKRRIDAVPTEHMEQAALFRWAEEAKATHPSLGLMFAIPNFAGRIGRLTAIHGAKLKREGRKKGVPDVMLPVPKGGYHGLFVEMKRVRGGSVSAEQRAWLACLTDHGYRAVRCKGWREARVVILDYLYPHTTVGATP